MVDVVEASQEVNFDGLVGPTHNYGGLSFGNRASMVNARSVSHPRAAALEGIAKMRQLIDLGVPQAVLPPHQRPDPTALAQLGFIDPTSAPTVVAVHAAMTQMASTVPELLPTVMSASSMWSANAATVTPSSDSGDGRLHLTPANLVSITHRSFEARQATPILRRIFADRRHFVVHDPLPATPALADEGAANHNRFASPTGGVHLYVFGRDHHEPVADGDGFPRRQTQLASRLIARSHGVDPHNTVFVRQGATAINTGAFHNDVVSVSHRNVLLAHQHAFTHQHQVYEQLRAQVGDSLWIEEATDDDFTLDDAISSYLFNSQLVTRSAGPSAGNDMVLVHPTEAAENPRTRAFIDRLVTGDSPITAAVAADVRHSMRNGGGPACLRLRVPLTADERRSVGGRVLADHDLLDQLENWVNRHYRHELHLDHLADPHLYDEVCAALDELTQILDLGHDLYPFQRA